MGWDMLTLNDMLPFRFTEAKVDRLVAKLYWKRNSMLTGILFAPEFSGHDLIHESEFIDDPRVYE